MIVPSRVKCWIRSSKRQVGRRIIDTPNLGGSWYLRKMVAMPVHKGRRSRLRMDLELRQESKSRTAREEFGRSSR